MVVKMEGNLESPLRFLASDHLSGGSHILFLEALHAIYMHACISKCRVILDFLWLNMQACNLGGCYTANAKGLLGHP